MRAVTMTLGARAALLAASLHVCLGLYSMGIVLPQMARAFAGTAHVQLLSQLVGGLTGLSFAVTSPIVGRLIERHGYGRVYFWSSIVFALAGTSVMLLDNLYLILLTRILVGASVAGTLVAAITGIGTLPDGNRAKFLGLFTLVGGILALLFYYVVARLAVWSWRVPFALHLLGLVIVPLILTLPQRVERPPALGSKSGAVAIRHALPPVSLMAVALFVGMAGVLPGLFAPFYLAGLGIINPGQVMLPLMATAIAVMPASASYGWLQQRLGIGAMFTACLLLTGIGCALAGLSGTLLALSAALAVMGLGLGISAANLNAAAVASEPESPGRAIGTVNGIYYGAQAVLPFVAQGLSEIFGASGVFGVFAIVSLVWGTGYLVAALRNGRFVQAEEKTV